MDPSVEDALRQAITSITPTHAERQATEHHLRAITEALSAAGWPLAEALLGGATARDTEITRPWRVKYFLLTTVKASAVTPDLLLAQMHAALCPLGASLPDLDPQAHFVEVSVSPDLTLALIPAVRGSTKIQRNGRLEEVPCLMVPDRGQWVPTPLPASQREICDRADQQAGGQMRPLLRLLKRWNRDHGVPLHPKHLEVLCYSAFPGPPPDLLTGLVGLFRYLASAVLEPCPDPTGIGPRLDRGLPQERRHYLSLVLRGAAASVEQAQEATEQGYASEAHRLLRDALGETYPHHAPEPLPVLLCLDVYGALPVDDLKRAAGIDDPEFQILRQSPERPLTHGALRPEDWERLGRVVATLAAQARALRRPEGPPLRLYICGLAPLPLFVQLGMELSAWLGKQIFINRRPDGTWDRMPLQAAVTSDAPVFFDFVRGLRQADPSPRRGRVGLFVAPANYTTPVAAIEAFLQAQGEDLAGLVEIRSERHAVLDTHLAPVAAAELILLCRQLRAAYPAAGGVALFVAGPASLAYIAGRAINPNVLGSVLAANFQPPDYVLALRLPFQGGVSETRPARLRVRKLSLAGFRGLGAQQIDFGDGLTVLVGVNGAGKTSVLDALALLLSQFINELWEAPERRYLREEDITLGQETGRCEIRMSLDDTELSWSQQRTRTARSVRHPRIDDSAYQWMMALRRDMEEDSGASLPLAVYYSVNRGDIEIPERLRKKGERDRLAVAYDLSLDKGAADFRAFFEWFKEREDGENAERRGNAAYEDRHLAAVRHAIERLLPGFRDPRVRRTPLRLVVSKGNLELSVNQLSDGERSLLALVGDLARRLTEAHPALIDPLQGGAVVLIDEIELHLHPGWQQRVIEDLRRTFPACQFIVTTHSPHVLSTVAVESIRVLAVKEGTVSTFTPGWQTRGAESSAVLAAVMDVDPVPDIQEAHMLSDYRALIQRGQASSPEALALRAKLDAHFGAGHPYILDCDRLIRFAAFKGQRGGGAAPRGE